MPRVCPTCGEHDDVEGGRFWTARCEAAWQAAAEEVAR